MREKIKKYSTFLRNRKSLLIFAEILAAVAIITIFFIKVTGYTHLDLSPSNDVKVITAAYDATTYNISTLSVFGSCPKDEVKITTGFQFLCRSATPSSTYQNIFDTMPRDPNGNEVLYGSLNTQDQTAATDLMKNVYEIQGYPNLTLKSLPTWTEDPYNDASWRVGFYSLSFMTPLLNAATSTHNSTYVTKLLSLINSFDIVGINQPNAGETPQIVALRTMNMLDIWWKLRALNMLPISTSTQMLTIIQKQETYLVKTSNYDSNIDEAAALYATAISLPKLSTNSSAWVTLAVNRINSNVISAVSSDGALIGHSSNEDLIALVKYWDLYTYSRHYDHTLSSDFYSRIQLMVTYAMYLLQPNGTTPVIGSAVSITIKNTGEYADIGNSFPEFLYVITKGDEGHAPTKKAIQFPTIGRTILRSGWQASDYTQQTQTIFNYSSTTGASSQLDSLSLNIFSGGMPLIVSPGPTSATQDSSIKTYLQSTKSQNTVYVDGQDQSQGTSSSSTLISTPNYASQSASNTLNLHVTQERQVIQIGGGLDVVLDKLSSSDNKQHTFQQEFNFAPGMSYTHTGSTVIAQGSKAQQRIEITQLGSGVTTSDNHGINTLSTKGGICTENKLEILPCNQVVYTTKGTSSTYVTLIQIGKQDVNLTDQLKGSVLTITKDGKTYTINITDKTGTPIQATASDTKAPSLNETSIDNFSTPANWSVSGGTVTAGSDAYASGKSSLALTGSDAVMSKQVSLDLTNSDIVLRMKLSDITNLGNVSIVMHSGSGSAHLNLLNAYQSLTSSDPVGTGEDVAIDQQSNIGWSTISLAKGSARTEQGEWIIEGQGFSWSSINQIDLTIESSDGLAKQVEFGQLSTTPEQPNTTIGIVFDDGSSSILPAVDYMNQKNIQGSVAVIGKYVAQQTKGYLTLDQLKQLQSAKWSLVNHSYNHQDAISKYYDNNDLQGFTSDILEGAQLLEQDGIDTDPNWYIYPHGTTNPTVESIVGQYYKFARTEHRGPEGFPFGSPLAVKDFVVDDTTTVSAVERAIDDANTYHQILLLTFHRIHATATDKSGYDLGQFEQIVDYLSSTHSNALSLNEIDTANRVPINTLKITPGVGAELTSTVSVQHTSIFVLIGQFLKSIFFGGLTQNVHAASMDTSSIALSSNSTSTFPVSLFKADLSGNGGILTNEFSYWHPESGCAYTSSSLNVTSGTLFSTQGVGYSGIPTTESQSVCESQVKTNSATFTMTTKQSNFTDVKISLDYKIISHTNGGAAFTSYDGLHLLVGYQNQNALYATSLFRWDNETVIKKKIASSTIECSSPNSMDCYESLGLTTESAQLSSLNQWHHADITFLTDGTSVRIVEVIDGQQLLDVTDQGIISKSYPIGSVGIQANNTEFSFKNFDVNGN